MFDIFGELRVQQIKLSLQVFIFSSFIQCLCKVEHCIFEQRLYHGPVFVYFALQHFDTEAVLLYIIISRITSFNR